MMMMMMMHDDDDDDDDVYAIHSLRSLEPHRTLQLMRDV